VTPRRPASTLLAAAALGALLFTGCADLRVGAPIPKEKVQEIRFGFTNQDRVLTLFGPPLRKAPGQDGEIWTYRWLDGRGTSQELTISFTGGVVSTYSYY
jgi:outer membrane protein assembly factor BamE (lipoprotein component of BamABCDE complex)